MERRKHKDRKIEVYNILIVRKDNKIKYEEKNILRNLIQSFLEYNKNNEIRCKIATKNLMYNYVETLLHDNVLEITMNYAKYNKKIEIIDVNNGTTTKGKDFNEGDKESQHMSILFWETRSNHAAIAFEKIHGAVNKADLENDLNKYFSNEYPGNYDKLKVEISSLPDSDFLTELSEMNRISAIELQFDSKKTNLPPEISFSNNGSLDSKKTSITYKPCRSASLPKNSVKKLYEQYKETDNSKLLRIKVNGTNRDGAVHIDTKYCKYSKYTVVELDDTGLVSSQSIFGKLREIANNIDESLIDVIIEE